MFKVGDEVQIISDCPENLHDRIEEYLGVPISNLYGVVCSPHYIPYGTGTREGVILDVPVSWYHLNTREWLDEHHVNHASLELIKPRDKLKDTISRIENRHKRLANV